MIKIEKQIEKASLSLSLQAEKVMEISEMSRSTLNRRTGFHSTVTRAFLENTNRKSMFTTVKVFNALNCGVVPLASKLSDPKPRDFSGILAKEFQRSELRSYFPRECLGQDYLTRFMIEIKKSFFAELDFYLRASEINRAEYLKLVNVSFPTVSRLRSTSDNINISTMCKMCEPLGLFLDIYCGPLYCDIWDRNFIGLFDNFEHERMPSVY